MGRWEFVSVLSQEMRSSAETHFPLLLASAYPVICKTKIQSSFFLFKRREVLKPSSSLQGPTLHSSQVPKYLGGFQPKAEAFAAHFSLGT